MIVIERILYTPVEEVWKAITVRDEMKQWYFDIPAFKPEVGFTFQFKGQGKKGDEFVHRCEDKNGKTTIKVSFEVENMNSLELHRSGWQVIIG